MRTTESFPKILAFSAILLFVLAVFVPVVRVDAAGSLGFERSLGQSAAAMLLKEYGGEYILPVQERLWVEEIFRRLVAVTSRQDLEYNLTVLNSWEKNAFALPGGYIFVTRGLLKMIGLDQTKLAAVLGHEIAHVEKKHGLNAVLRQLGLLVVMEVGALWLDQVPADVLRMSSALLVQILQLGWGREAEFEADHLGQVLAVEAGFGGIGGITLFHELARQSNTDPPTRLLRSHPEFEDRRVRLEQNLIKFWSEPRLVSDRKIIESLKARRNSSQDGRTDPKMRYLISMTSSDPGGLAIWDSQTGSRSSLAEDIVAGGFAWSPQGRYLAVWTDVEGVLEQQVLIYDRFGRLLEKLAPVQWGRITALVWAPDEEMLALEFQDGERHSIVVAWWVARVFLPITSEFEGMEAFWCTDRLYFWSGEDWYWTEGPELRPVVIPEPVPRVLQRKQTPSVVVSKEGNTIRLTRPSLAH